MENDDTVTCPKCNSKIIRKCQAIHNIACKQNKKQDKGFFERLFGGQEGQQQTQCMIPCTQCGQSFPFSVYSQHMTQCVGHQLTKCQQCKILFPTFLFEQHLGLCQGPKQVFQLEEEQFEQNNPLHALISLLAQQQIKSEQLSDEPLGQKQISNLKLVKIQVQQDCSICCCQMKKIQNHIQLNCKHIYHKACISSWLKKNPRCPMCRANAKSI